MPDDSIFTDFKEHPEFPIEDERRFTISIKHHQFMPYTKSELIYQNPSWADKCSRCGYRKEHRGIHG